jgi:hypothetical protein
MLRTEASGRNTEALRGPLASAEGWRRLGISRSARVVEGRVSTAPAVGAATKDLEKFSAD